MADDPVKTLILKAFEDAVAQIDIIGTVKRNPPSPPKRETANFPAAWIYDDTESKVKRNRYSMNRFAVQTETYFLAEEEGASDKADLVDAKIYKTVLADPGILALVQDISAEEGNSVSKQYLDEFMGVVISRFVIRYAHALGDPFDPAK